MLNRALASMIQYACLICMCLSASLAQQQPQDVLYAPNSLGEAAQEDFTEDLANLILTPTSDSGHNAFKVLVSATRGLQQDPLDIPQSVSIITANELEEGSYSSVDDALRRLLPNVGMAQVGQPFTSNLPNTTSNYWNQGFSIRGLGNQRVLVMTDNVRQAGNGIGYGGGNLNLYDLYSIEDIEVIKGPASVMYGTDALGGVVNVLTRSPKRRTVLGANAGLKAGYDGSFNTWRTGAYVDIGGKHGGLVLGGNYLDAGLPYLPHGQKATGGSFEQYGAYTKADYYVCERTRLRALANFTQDKDIQATNQAIPIRNTSIPFIIDIPKYRRSELGFELQTLDINQYIEEIKCGVYWQQLRRKSNWTNAIFTRNALNQFYLDNAHVATNETVNTYELQPLIRLNFEPHILTLGMDIAQDNAYLPETRTTTFRQAIVPSTLAPQPDTSVSRVRADARQWRIGAYAQDNWDLDPFEVVIGGRLDYYDINNKTAQYSHNNTGLSGSLGIVYHLDEATCLYTNVASGLRVADLSERFQQSVIPFHGLIQVNGNPVLAPERSYSAELGLKRHEGWVDFEGAIFINQIDNYIGLSPISKLPNRDIVGVWQYNNLGGVLLYGAELSAYFLPNDPWQSYITLGRTYTDNPEKIAEPSWACNFGTLYNFYPHYQGLEFVRPELIGRALRPSYDSLNKTNSAGFCTFDAQLTLGLDAFTASSLIIGCHNIFNKVYQEPFFGSNMPGRGVYASLQIDF